MSLKLGSLKKPSTSKKYGLHMVAQSDLMSVRDLPNTSNMGISTVVFLNVLKTVKCKGLTVLAIGK